MEIATNKQDCFDIILANFPFGGKERKKKVQQNFAVKTGETVFLFLKHFIKILKPGDPVESSSESPDPPPGVRFRAYQFLYWL